MRTARVFLATVAVVAATTVGAPAVFAQQQAPAAQQPPVQINATAIGGVVTSRFGPEAGVWVIAETTDLSSKFAKIVVTDERGRYVIPELPAANYKVWVRGYGLVDSPKVDAKPGAIQNLTAVIAPTPRTPRSTIRQCTGTRWSKSPTRACFRGPGQTVTGSRPASGRKVNISTRRCSTVAAIATSSATT